MYESQRDVCIAVIGPGRSRGQENDIAAEVGALLARAGAIVVCGGMGGVMEAVARGAREADGTVIGILPGEYRAEGNPFLSISIPTDLGHARNAIVVRCADAVIAVGGEYGTLSEIGLALKMSKPVIGIGTWALSKGGTEDTGIEPATDAADAVERALARASGRRR